MNACLCRISRCARYIYADQVQTTPTTTAPPMTDSKFDLDDLKGSQGSQGFGGYASDLTCLNNTEEFNPQLFIYSDDSDVTRIRLNNSYNSSTRNSYDRIDDIKFDSNVEAVQYVCANWDTDKHTWKNVLVEDGNAQAGDGSWRYTNNAVGVLNDGRLMDKNADMKFSFKHSHESGWSNMSNEPFSCKQNKCQLTPW